MAIHAVVVMQPALRHVQAARDTPPPHSSLPTLTAAATTMRDPLSW